VSEKVSGKMTRECCWVTCLAWVAAAAGGLASCRGVKPPRSISPTRRHVLLLTVDTLRMDYLSANGYDLPTTPFLDRLSGNGFNFTHAVTPIPRTTQALASLLTGGYPRSTGVRNLTDHLARGTPSFPELAQRRGYATLAVVSNHLLTKERGLDRGFHVYDTADDTRDATQTTEAALRHMDGYRPEDPLLLWVHYIDPHVPYYPPPELALGFDPEYRGPYDTHFGERGPGRMPNQPYPKELGKAKAVYQNDLPPDVNAHVRRLYAAEIRHTDDEIGRLVDGLRRRLGDDWSIVFTADHGESLGENQYYFDHGEYVSNAEIRVPLVLTLPGPDPLHGQRTIDDWVSLVDVMPTMVDLLGLEIPEGSRPGVDGRSLLPYLTNGSLPERPVFAECGESFYPAFARRRLSFDVPGRLRTVLLGKLKLVWTPGRKGDLEYDLYDLDADPHETADLYEGNPRRAAPLRALLHKWAERDGATSGTISEEDRERLRSLGYLE
jgi:arylsulfatase